MYIIFMVSMPHAAAVQGFLHHEYYCIVMFSSVALWEVNLEVFTWNLTEKMLLLFSSIFFYYFPPSGSGIYNAIYPPCF